MPIFMDVHTIPGVTAKAVAEAHKLDLGLQEEYKCKCMTYWIDEQRENVFCLIEAPDKESVSTLHGKAHGLIPNKIIEVNSTLVESFLGRIYDPSEASVTDGLKIFHDPSFRILLVTKITDPVLQKHIDGEEKTKERITNLNRIIRKNISVHEGREAEHHGDGFIISFSSATQAVNCALDIQKEFSTEETEATGMKMSINAGEPIEKSNSLFGDTIRLAEYMCTVHGNSNICVSSSVKELVAKDLFQKKDTDVNIISPQDEDLLNVLFSSLEQHYQEPEFDIENYSLATTMSQSQLYRKTVALTGLSPNQLLKDYRLEKSKELLKKRRYSIAQITFESGFTSPSYYTKCFKKKYGLLPNEYVDLL